ncbi:hypothetical protein COJ36_28470 [Priestia megaterium]|nr:hypothetical protein COJ36_28470 [Priestia megaterium]
MHKKSLRDSRKTVVYPKNDDSQDIRGKEWTGGQINHNGTTGVNQLLVRGCYGLLNTLFSAFTVGIRVT